MKIHYLEQCLQDHSEFTRRKFNKKFDLYKIESLVEHVRQKGFTWDDFQKIRKNEFWDYEKFWPVPDETTVCLGLKSVSERLDFWNYKRKKKELITGLYEVFKNIEIVSTILRFVIPEGFGIYSPPVALILDVRRGKTDIETYMNYISNLEEIHQHYPELRTKTIAQVDMALWTLNEHINGITPSADIRQKFEDDEFIWSLKAKNMAAILRISDIALAQSIIDVNRVLSAQIAGICFEQMVFKIYEKKMGSLYDEKEDVTVDQKINRLLECGKIDSLKAGKWHNARKTRNKAIHAPKKLTEKSIRELICVTVDGSLIPR